MALTTLAPPTQGPMGGDYMSTSFMSGKAWSVFAVGLPGSGGTLNEAMYTLAGGLAAPGGRHHVSSGGAATSGSTHATTTQRQTAF